MNRSAYWILAAAFALSGCSSRAMDDFDLHLADPASHQPIADLQPYLGTAGYAVILDSSANRYLHVHAVENMSGGSDVMFHTEFPAAGLYKIWGQFQVNGRLIVAPFVLSVQ